MRIETTKSDSELDCAVAKAVGIKTAVACRGGVVLISHREWDELRGIEHPTCEGDVSCIPFTPSTDLNAAFEAAEKVSDYIGVIKNQNSPNGFWEAKLSLLDGWDEWSRQPTPALAICAAILKLKENCHVPQPSPCSSDFRRQAAAGTP